MYGGMSPPMIKNSMDRGSVIIRHREYVGDIGGSIVFANRVFSLNPGLNGTFPWLSQVAAAFEQYRFRGLIWEFKSCSADSVLNAQPNVGMGTVVMATQYNSLDPGFTNKIEMENYEYANSCKPACSFIHPVECAINQTPNTPLYIRTGAIPTQSDERLYDLGNFNIATSGLAADGGVIGELWATFEVELFKPKFSFNEALELAIDHFGSNPAQSISSTTIMGSDLTNAYYAGNIGCWITYVVDGAGDTVMRLHFPQDGTVNTDNCFFVHVLVTTALAGSMQVGIGTTDVIRIGLGVDNIVGFAETPTILTDPRTVAYFSGASESSGASTSTTLGVPGTTRFAFYTQFLKAIPLGDEQQSAGPRWIDFQFLGLSVLPVTGETDVFVMRIPSTDNWVNSAQTLQDISRPGI